MISRKCIELYSCGNSTAFLIDNMLRDTTIINNCTFFESYQLSTLIHYFFYAFTVAYLSLLITYCSICYYPALSVKNRNRLLKISYVSAKIIGLPTPMLSEIFDLAILKKARAVATESGHPLSTFFHALPSRRRYRCIKCKTSRYSRSFVPVAIRMLNAK